MTFELKTANTLSNRLSYSAIWATMQFAIEQPTIENDNFRKRNFSIYVFFEDETDESFETAQTRIWEDSNKTINLVRSSKERCLRNDDYVVADDGFVIECNRYIDDVEYNSENGHFAGMNMKYWLKVRYNNETSTYDTFFTKLNENKYKEMRNSTSNLYSFNEYQYNR